MNDNGFEIRHEENLREHYAKTLMAWCDNLDAHWDEAVAEVGQGTARVWRLYMAGCSLGFDRNVVQLHQILGVKLNKDGVIGDAPAPQLGARRRAREDLFVSLLQDQPQSQLVRTRRGYHRRVP